MDFPSLSSKGLLSYFTEQNSSQNSRQNPSNSKANNPELLPSIRKGRVESDSFGIKSQTISSLPLTSNEKSHSNPQSTGLLTSLKENIKNLRESHKFDENETIPILNKIENLRQNLFNSNSNKHQNQNIGLLGKTQAISNYDSEFFKGIESINEQISQNLKQTNKSENPQIFNTNYIQRQRRPPEETSLYKEKLIDILEKHKSNPDDSQNQIGEKIWNKNLTDEMLRHSEGEGESFIAMIIKKTDELINNFKSRMASNERNYSRKVEKVIQTDFPETKLKVETHTNQLGIEIENSERISPNKRLQQILNLSKSPKTRNAELKSVSPVSDKSPKLIQVEKTRSRIDKFQELIGKSQKQAFSPKDSSNYASGQKEEQKYSDIILPSKSVIYSTDNNLAEILELSGEQPYSNMKKIFSNEKIHKRTSITLESDQKERKKEVKYSQDLVSSSKLPGESTTGTTMNRLKSKRKVYSKSNYNSRGNSVYASPGMPSSNSLNKKPENRFTFNQISSESINKDSEELSEVVSVKRSRRSSQIMQMSMKSAPNTISKSQSIKEEVKEIEVNEEEDESNLPRGRLAISKSPLRSPNQSGGKRFDFRNDLTNQEPYEDLNKEDGVIEMSDEDSIMKLNLNEKQQDPYLNNQKLQKDPTPSFKTKTASGVRTNTFVNYLTVIQTNSNVFELCKMFEPDKTFKYCVDYSEFDANENLKDFSLIEKYLEIIWGIKFKPFYYKALILSEILRKLPIFGDKTSFDSIQVELQKCQILIALDRIYEAEENAESMLASLQSSEELPNEITHMRGEFKIIIGWVNLMKSYKNVSLTRVFTTTKAFQDFKESYLDFPHFNRKRKIGQILLEILNENQNNISLMCSEASAKDPAYEELYNFLQLSAFLDFQPSEDEKNILANRISELLSDHFLSYFAFLRLYSYYKKKGDWVEVSKITASAVLKADTMEDTFIDKINYLHCKALLKNGYVEESLTHSIKIILMKLKGFLGVYFLTKVSWERSISHLVQAIQSVDSAIQNLNSLENQNLVIPFMRLKAKCLKAAGFNIDSYQIFLEIQKSDFKGISKELYKKEIEKEIIQFEQTSEIFHSLMADIEERKAENYMDEYLNSFAFDRKLALIKTYDAFLSDTISIFLNPKSNKINIDVYHGKNSQKIESWIILWQAQRKRDSRKTWEFDQSKEEIETDYLQLVDFLKKKIHLLKLSRAKYIAFTIPQIISLLGKQYSINTENEIILFMEFKSLLKIDCYQAFELLKNNLEIPGENDESDVSLILYYFLGKSFTRIKTHEKCNNSGYFMESKKALGGSNISKIHSNNRIGKNSLIFFIQNLAKPSNLYTAKAYYYLSEFMITEDNGVNASSQYYKKSKEIFSNQDNMTFLNKTKRFVNSDKLNKMIK